MKIFRAVLTVTLLMAVVVFGGMQVYAGNTTTVATDVDTQQCDPSECAEMCKDETCSPEDCTELCSGQQCSPEECTDLSNVAACEPQGCTQGACSTVCSDNVLTQ